MIFLHMMTVNEGIGEIFRGVCATERLSQLWKKLSISLESQAFNCIEQLDEVPFAFVFDA